MLERRIATQQEILVQCAVSAARTNEVQLESDVLRAKLADLTYAPIVYHTSTSFCLVSAEGFHVQLEAKAIRYGS